VKGLSWFFVVILLEIFFAVIYYFAPDVKTSHWHWLTPGATVGIIGWFLATMSFRVCVHFFNAYSVTYGGLGAVIILLTWFYPTGLMLLLGAAINSQIEAAAAEKYLLKLKKRNLMPPSPVIVRLGDWNSSPLSLSSRSAAKEKISCGVSMRVFVNSNLVIFVILSRG
jgi:membrane protein